MKKYIPVSFIAVFIVFASVLTAVSKNNDAKLIRCRIINVTDEFIEVKKGRNELTLYTQEDTKYVSKDGEESGREIIEICQYVDVYYKTEDSRKILSKIVITKESDCIK